MRISRKLQACLTIKQNQESILGDPTLGAFLGDLPSFLALSPNTNPLCSVMEETSILFFAFAYFSKGHREALLSLWSLGPLYTDAY